MSLNGNREIQIQKQVQNELIYIVKQDTLNFIGILYEALAVYNYFKDPEHQMCQIFKNRLITQINLSNAIYYDQKESENEINTLKQDAAEKIKQVLKPQNIDQSQDFKNLIDHHLNKNLSNDNVLDQLKLNFSQQNQTLSDTTVQKIFNSMNHQDQQFNQIRNGQIHCKQITLFEIQNLAQIKYQAALQMLKDNFKSINEGVNQQQQQQQTQNNQKEMYKITQFIVQKWIDAYVDPNKDFSTTIYKNISESRQNGIVDVLKQNYVEGKSSCEIKKIIESIQYYQSSGQVKGPVRSKDPLKKLQEFNNYLKEQSI